MVAKLAQISDRFVKEVVLLRTIFEENPRVLPYDGIWLDLHALPAQSYALIRLHDAWARYCRTLILASAAGKAETRSGVYVPPSPLISTQGNALLALRATFSPRQQRRVFWEPDWYKPHEAIEAATRLMVSNIASVNSLGAVTPGAIGDTTEDLRVCRNCLAHRSEQSNKQVNNLRLRLAVSVDTDILEIADSPVAGGATLFRRWCFDLANRARNATN